MRVAGAVGPLVVEANDQRHRLEAGNAPDHLGAPLRVQPHEAALVLVEPAGLAEDVRAAGAACRRRGAARPAPPPRSPRVPVRAARRRPSRWPRPRASGGRCHRPPRPAPSRARESRPASRPPSAPGARGGSGPRPRACRAHTAAPFLAIRAFAARPCRRRTVHRAPQPRPGRERRPPRPVRRRAGAARSGPGSVPAPATTMKPPGSPGARTDDPRLLEAEYGACVTGQAVEHHARIAQPLGRRHPCRRWGGKPQHCAHCRAVKFFRKLRSSDNPRPHGSPGAFPTRRCALRGGFLAGRADRSSGAPWCRRPRRSSGP